MKFFSSRIVWGALLIGTGSIFLLQNLNLLPENPAVWTLTFGAVSLYFFIGFLSSAGYWWAAFPAFTFLALALVIWLDGSPLRGQLAGLSGAVFLGTLGLSFIAVYLRAPRHWWAIIPAGALLSIASVVVLETLVRDPGPVETGGVLFLGMGLTFLLVYVLPSAGARQGWAVWPALALLLFGGLITAAATDLLNLLWPVVLIVVGLLVLARGLRR